MIIVLLICTAYVQKTNSCFADNQCKKSEKRPVLVSLNYDDLLKNKQDIKAGKPEVMVAYKKLISIADGILKKEPLKVTDGVVPPSGNNRDYYTISEYAWPSTDSKDGMPYTMKDGYLNKEASGDGYDLKRYNTTIFNVNMLATAWFYSDDEKYAKKAAEILRVWFLDAETGMIPAFKYTSGIPGVYDGRSYGIIYGVVLMNMVDYVNLLTLSSSWTAKDNDALKKWFADYINWMQTSEFGKLESKTGNNHEVYYFAQLASFALYNNDIATAKIAVENGKRMIDEQITADGIMPREIKRTRSFHYSLYGLKAFCILASCGEVVGIDLWNYRTTDGRSIKTSIDFILPYLLKDKAWSWPDVGDDMDKDITNSILFIRPASKAYKTKALQQAEKRITQSSPTESEKIWLIGRNTQSSN